MADYTKGEWTINTVKGIRIESQSVIKCICLLGDVEDEDYANAQLIAAAPKLYEACKQALRTFEAHKIPPSDPRYMMIAQALIEAKGKKE